MGTEIHNYQDWRTAAGGELTGAGLAQVGCQSSSYLKMRCLPCTLVGPCPGVCE